MRGAFCALVLGSVLRGFAMARTGNTRKIGRSAITGKFMPVAKAKKQGRTSVVETIKKPDKKS